MGKEVSESDDRLRKAFAKEGLYSLLKELLRPAALGKVVLGAFALLSVVFQENLLSQHNFGITDSTKAAVSAAIGFKNRRGLSVSSTEAMSVSWKILQRDLSQLYRANDSRAPLHYLPGLALIMTAVFCLMGKLKLVWIVHAQVMCHTALSIVMARELSFRSPLAGLLAGCAWLFWLPYWRLNLRPDYDAWTSFVSLGAVISSLAFLRLRKRRFLFLAGVLCGLGLWIRDYLFMLPVVLAFVLYMAMKVKHTGLAFFVGPVVAFGLLLHIYHTPGYGSTGRLTRGAFWHTFMSGIGQFENDLGLETADASVKDLAERVSGRSFPSFYYEFDPDYNSVLKSVALDFIKRHPGIILRNAAYRVGWLIVPGAMPSYALITSTAAKAIVLVVSILLTGLAVLGFVRIWNESQAEALVILAPWVALLPLAGFYLVNKVPVIVMFVWIVFASHAVSRWWTSRPCSVVTR